MSLETIMQFDHLASVHDFIDNVIPEMLTKTSFLEQNYEKLR